jgi:RNA polymerase sigma-70 factor (ECF subfamily)
MADPPAPVGAGGEVTAAVTAAVVEEVFRAESGRALATLARFLGDIGAAEDAVQEAFVAALRRWPATGLPDRPGAWITTTARNRALDVVRREARRPAHEEQADRADRAVREALEATPPILHPVADDQLQLLFTCCHPALAPESRVALTLRLVCGLQVREIARALLHSEDAVARRLHRAKVKVREAGIPLRVPPPELLDERVPSVLGCVYLTFSEGYAATAGDDLVRHELCDEAVRLARLLVDLLPDDPGAQALLALLLLQDSRRPARLDAEGRIVLLADQDRSAWDQARIDDGLAWLDRAAGHRRALSAGAASYLLQAAIAAEHARAESWEATDWPAVVRHYDQLAALTRSPVVLVNRAVAVSFADGPAAALPLLDELADDPRLAQSHLLPTARADVRRRLGHAAEAVALYRLALTLAATAPERAFLRQRIAELEAPA